jgi:sortase (surface protein transpeptidase)
LSLRFAPLFLALGLAAAVVAVGRPGAPAQAQAPAATAPASIAEQLRYIGRDGLTGMPTSVSDRFIAEVERAIERYGQDEVKPIPPPPVEDVDVVRLQAPAIGIDAPVGRYGVDRYGRLDVPQDSKTVGWNPAYNDLPGEGRATFFAAHFQFAGRPGVFNKLSSLAPGDEVTALLSDGTASTYRVTSTIDYALGVIDMGALLRGREGVESITLMTCSGPPNEGNFPLRTVVLAERVG